MQSQRCPTWTLTFPKFLTQTLLHTSKMNEVRLLTILQELAINGNHGAQQEFSVSTKVLKKLYHFNRNSKLVM